MVLGVERFRLDCHGLSRSLLLSFCANFSSLLLPGLVFGPMPPAPSLPWWLPLLLLRCLVVWFGLLLLSLRCLWLLLLSLRYLGLRLLPLSPRCLLCRQLALRRCVASLAVAAPPFVVVASLAFTAGECVRLVRI